VAAEVLDQVPQQRRKAAVENAAGIVEIERRERYLADKDNPEEWG
jgi:hypothetical protein